MPIHCMILCQSRYKEWLGDPGGGDTWVQGFNKENRNIHKRKSQFSRIDIFWNETLISIHKTLIAQYHLIFSERRPLSVSSQDAATAAIECNQPLPPSALSIALSSALSWVASIAFSRLHNISPPVQYFYHHQHCCCNWIFPPLPPVLLKTSQFQALQWQNWIW